MKSPVSRFLLKAFTLTLVCGILQWLWGQHGPAQWRASSGFFLLGLFAVFSTLVHLFLLSAAKGSGAVFIRSFMAATAFKFFFYLLVLVILLLYSSDSKQALIMHFLFYYAVFTVFEVGQLYAETSKKKS